MEFSNTEEQLMIANQARDLLNAESPTRVIRELAQRDRDGYDKSFWKKMADVGWLGITVPEEYGSQGGNLDNLFGICEEMGRVGLVGPFFSTVVLSSQALLADGSEAQKKHYLPRIAGGETVVSWAMLEAEIENELELTETTATPQDGGYVLDGTKLFVPYAHVADYMMVLARLKGTSGEDGLTLFVMPADVSRVTIELDSTLGVDRVCSVILNKVRLGSESVVGVPGKAAGTVKRVLRIATVAKMSEMIGGFANALNMTVEYVKDRHAWGYPIGARQAVQHILANAYMDLNLSRVLLRKAAWALVSGLPADLEISIAKSFINEKYKLATKAGVQLHGAIAYCIDHDMQVFVKHAKIAESTLGSTDYHLAKVADGIGL